MSLLNKLLVTKNLRLCAVSQLRISSLQYLCNWKKIPVKIGFEGILAATAPYGTMPLFLPSDVNACANAALQLNCSTIR